jgi:hypothetical protein
MNALAGDDRAELRSLGLGQIADLLSYLHICLEDHDEANNRLLALIDSLPSGKEQTNLADRRRLVTTLHLRIETFYVFSKILLDKTAQAIEHYFGPGRKASLERHSKLRKNLAAFISQKGLSDPPPSLIEKMAEVEARISDYRDHFVTHEQSPRSMKATKFDRAMGETAIVPTRLYSSTVDVLSTSASEPPQMLMRLIESYIIELIDYLSLNADKARTA